MLETQYAIGRSKTGDQLHVCSVVTYADGRKSGGNNAHCNNHMHLRLIGAPWRSIKQEVRMRPGLFCRKCFGTDEARIIAREYLNATVTA